MIGMQWGGGLVVVVEEPKQSVTYASLLKGWGVSSVSLKSFKNPLKSLQFILRIFHLYIGPGKNTN